MEKFFDILGEIFALVVVAVFAVSIVNANFGFITNATVLNVINVIRNYGALALVGVVGLEAMTKRGWIFRIAFVVLAAIVVIFMFFPGTYENLIGLIK